MRKIAIVFIIAALATIAWMSECAAHGPCQVTVLGTAFNDSDCDNVLDVHNGYLDNAPDNCPNVPNGDCTVDPIFCDINEDGAYEDAEMNAGSQADSNGDGVGDACGDIDGDGVVDYLDTQDDRCEATGGSECIDTDDDTLMDAYDNCPADYNPIQEDTDDDGVGDVCDNCWEKQNPDQLDSDNDYVGDACPGSEGIKPDVNPDTAPPGPGTSPATAFNPLVPAGTGGCQMIPAAQGASSILAAVFAIVSIIALRRRS